VIRFVLVVLLIAAMIYLLVRHFDQRSAGKAAWGPAARKQRDHQGRRAIAPDDDEQFLRDLDKDLDKKRKEIDPGD
jgi:hypothetical protein